MRYRVDASELNVRTGPSQAFSVIRKLRRSEVVDDLDEAVGDWRRVGLENDWGWAHTSYLIPVEPDWLSVARAELGVAERPGTADNPRIVEYHSATSLRAMHDEVPWCASFVCWCLEQVGVAHTSSASARSFLTWGKPCVPTEGCVVVLRRGNPPSGHVGFYLRPHLPGRIHVLGGNQGNAVTITSFDESDVLAYRWPSNE